jgi:ketosteroid isomerase-like protein
MRQFAVFFIWIIAAGASIAQDGAAESAADAPGSSIPDTARQAAIHEQLRMLRERMFAAYEKRDMDALLADVAPDVVITWQNADRNNGHGEFKEFYNRMMKGESSVVKDVSTSFEVDDTSILYGNDTAIARGTQVDKFVLTDGSNFTLNSKWTATVVKENDAWKVASFHVSANIFDNPILDVAKGWLMKAGIGGGLVGLIVGLLIGRASRRKPTVA